PSCQSCTLSFAGEERIELAGRIELMQVVAAADMHCADEDLRNRIAAVRPFHHLAAQVPVSADVDLLEVDALAFQQGLGGVAIGAIPGGVDFDRRHLRVYVVPGGTYMVARGPATTRAKTSTSTWAAPARSRARAQASTVAPEVSTSSTRISRQPETSALRSAGTRKAPETFPARSPLSRPTCCGVARTRFRLSYSTGTSTVREMAEAREADWLKRRAQSRRQCRGTGTSASASRVSSRPARAIHWPIMPPSSMWSLYLNLCTSARATSS